MQNPEELWQVEVNGEHYDTSFAELTEWIAESSLLAKDKVRRGNLRWLEAGKVPPLRPFFDAKANGTEPPVVQLSVADASDADGEIAVSTVNLEHGAEPVSAPPADESEPTEEVVGIDQTICAIHTETDSVFLCEACSHGFCKACPESFGTSVRVCPYCGALCRSRKELLVTDERESKIQNDIREGFGFGDFSTALGYPWRFKSSLFFGGLIVAVMGYGQSAAGMGSYVLIGAAIICFILSTAFIFSMLANTVDSFAKGDIEGNFLAGFDDFSAWDDVVHPFFLAVGAFISSFGVAALLTAGLVWYAANTFTAQVDPAAAQYEELTKPSDQSTGHINAVKEKLRRQNQGRSGLALGPDGLTDAQRNTVEEEAEFQRISDLSRNYKKAQLESTIGKSPEVQEAEMQAMFLKFAQTAGIMIIFIGFAALWGAFYFPAACAVAGYTRSFAAAVNPLVGLDTIRHLGFDYIKILAMTFLMSIMSSVIGGMLAFIFSPFDLPSVGNLPAKFAASFVSFYFWIVFAVVLGFALYKNSDKLRLSR